MMSNERDESGLVAYRKMTLVFMTLGLAVPLGACTLSMCLLLGRPLVEGVVVALVLAVSLMVLGGQDDALREDFLEGTEEDWATEQQPPPRPPPKDGYYGW